jgi:hypothetical protein
MASVATTYSELTHYESTNMTISQDDQELLNLAAERFGVPVDVLTALLELEDSFPNFSVFGAKAEFTRRVNAILDLGSSKAEK